MARWHYRDAGLILRFYRWALAETAAGRLIALSREDQYIGRSFDAEGWRREFLRALDRRINLKAGSDPSWRKLDDLYQTELARDCRQIRDHATKRIAVHQIMTPELRRRFGHIITTRGDST